VLQVLLKEATPDDPSGAAAPRADALTFHQLRDVLTSGRFRKVEEGRYFILLSLAEAETLRCILHLRQGGPLVPDSSLAYALRCIPAGDAIFDASELYTPPQPYHASVSQNWFASDGSNEGAEHERWMNEGAPHPRRCSAHVPSLHLRSRSFRFLDSAMHFSQASLNVLLRSLPAQPMQRRLFFSTVVACRRRLPKRWEQTPLAKLFTLEVRRALLASIACTPTSPQNIIYVAHNLPAQHGLPA
jgi:hypothetical protein